MAASFPGRGIARASLFLFFGFGFTTARAGFTPLPAGYQVVDLGITAAGIGVSPGGELAVANGSTITLYNTYRNGRTQIGQITDSTDWSSLTDITFLNESKIAFGENGTTSTAWTADFTNPASPVAARLQPNGAFPQIQGVAATADRGTLVISGATSTSFAPGSLYLRTLKLSDSSVTNITPTGGVGTGFVGNSGVTAGGSGVLLDTNDPTFAGASGIARVFNLASKSESDISLTSGHGSGAYGIAFDSGGVAYLTTGTTISEISSIDSSPSVTEFGSFSDSAQFPTGIAFTGGSFAPNSGGSGALIVNGGFGSNGASDVFAVVPTPEPAGVMLIGVAGAALLLRRRRRSGSGAVAASALLAAACVAPVADADQFYASSVVATSVGAGQNSSFADPSLALGGPKGGGTTTGSTDVYSLGNGGTITLGFNGDGADRVIQNGAGPDFIVFGNPFNIGGSSTSVYAKLLYVEVSSNGTHFERFPVISNTPNPIGNSGTDTNGNGINPANVSGFGEVHPVLANVQNNSINPFDPSTAGGDAFDLSSLPADPLVDTSQIRYIRLVDVIGDGTQLDSNSHAIYDPSGSGPLNTSANVDALAVINGAVLPEPGIFGAALAGSVLVLLCRPSRDRRPSPNALLFEPEA